MSLILTAGILSPLLAIERSVEKSFPVGPNATLKLSTYRGSVIVEESAEARIRVEVRIDLGSDDPAQAERLFKSLDLALAAAPDGDTVTVRAQNPAESRPRFTWSRPLLDLGFRIQVPRTCNLELTTNDGDITVGSITGNVIARLRSGTISCGKIDGNVRAEAEAGDVVVSRCTGSIDLKVTRGTLRAGTIFGPAKLSSARGDIEIQSARGGLAAATSAGDVTVGFPRQLVGAANVKVDGGNIYARIDPATRCEINASATWGQVQTSLPIVRSTNGNSKRSLTGQLNGGGPVLTLKASGGNVKLEPFTEFID